MKLYVIEKEKNERKDFLEYLYSKGYYLDENCEENELLNSIFPIIIIDKKINFMRNVTVSACSVSHHISIEKARKIIEKI